jgi:hypothetical protein
MADLTLLLRVLVPVLVLGFVSNNEDDDEYEDESGLSRMRTKF